MERAVMRGAFEKESYLDDIAAALAEAETGLSDRLLKRYSEKAAGQHDRMRASKVLGGNVNARKMRNRARGMDQAGDKYHERAAARFHREEYLDDFVESLSPEELEYIAELGDTPKGREMLANYNRRANSKNVSLKAARRAVDKTQDSSERVLGRKGMKHYQHLDYLGTHLDKLIDKKERGMRSAQARIHAKGNLR